MEPNQNANIVQDTSSAPTTASAPSVPSMPSTASNAPVGSSKPGSDVVFQDKPKKSHGMLYGMILLAILAAGGIGFGVWAMMDGNSRAQEKDEQISQLQSQLAEKSEAVIEDDDVMEDVEREEGDDIEKKFGFRAAYADGIRDEESMVACAPGFANSCLILSLNGTVVVDFLGTNWEQLESNMIEHKRDREDITDKIDGRVVDVAVGHVGNGAFDVMLFLLDDGRVLYIHESDLLLQNYDMELVDGANGIVRLYGNKSDIDCAGFVQDQYGVIKKIMVDGINQNTGKIILKV